MSIRELRVRHDGCYDPVRRDGQDQHVHGHLLRSGSEKKRAVLDAGAPIRPPSGRKRQIWQEGSRVAGTRARDVRAGGP